MSVRRSLGRVPDLLEASGWRRAGERALQLLSNTILSFHLSHLRRSCVPARPLLTSGPIAVGSHARQALLRGGHAFLARLRCAEPCSLLCRSNTHGKVCCGRRSHKRGYGLVTPSRRSAYLRPSRTKRV